MKGDLVCLVYVDDTILAGPNLDNINRKSLDWESVPKIKLTAFNLGMKVRLEIFSESESKNWENANFT